MVRVTTLRVLAWRPVQVIEYEYPAIMADVLVWLLALACFKRLKKVVIQFK